ncbi:MAG: class I SAM-dependent methyltransferase, partial [Phycisphaerae bacterium]|nr:class I SAM-dependent methyltransferase [Phycisphaerae bacterium]
MKKNRQIPPMSERKFRAWVDTNAGELLGEIGVRENQIVLDYGCGSGTCTVPAARIVGDGGKVYALDINAAALRKVRKKARKAALRNIRIIHSDGTPSTELPQVGVDVALLYDVMQKIDDWRALFGELHRILRPHG